MVLGSVSSCASKLKQSQIIKTNDRLIVLQQKQAKTLTMLPHCDNENLNSRILYKGFQSAESNPRFIFIIKIHILLRSQISQVLLKPVLNVPRCCSSKLVGGTGSFLPKYRRNHSNNDRSCRCSPVKSNPSSRFCIVPLLMHMQ